MLDFDRPSLRTILLGSMFLVISAFVFLPADYSKAAELIMLEEEGCPWCDLWREEVGDIYPVTEEGKKLPLRAINIHDALPDDLAFMTKGNYTPTFVVVEDGKEYGRIRGYPGESFFWGLLSVIIDKLPKTDKST